MKRRLQSVCLEILNGNPYIDPLNSTYVIGIPKIKNSKNQKLVAKTFTNRSKVVLSEIISVDQNTNVYGCLIMVKRVRWI